MNLGQAAAHIAEIAEQYYRDGDKKNGDKFMRSAKKVAKNLPGGIIPPLEHYCVVPGKGRVVYTRED